MFQSLEAVVVKERARQEQSIDRFIEKSSAAQTNVMSDHPILKRKRYNVI